MERGATANMQNLASTPTSPLPFSEPDAVVRIPVQRIRCGTWDARNDERWLEYEPSTTNLKFLYRDRKHTDHDHCTMFRCQDISAADLRVVAKFGFLDAMTGTLTVECQSLIQVDLPHRTPLPYLSASSYVVEATFHANYTGQMRDLLRSLRHAKKMEAILANANNNDGDTLGKKCFKLREGLPDWVPYIPHRLYTPTVRQTMEFVILLYTVFSIAWAGWQLYRHVDFIRAHVQPVIDALKYHIHLLDKCLQFLNTVFEELTEQWLAYLKPGYVILSSFASPLVAAGKQVWSVVSKMSSALQVVIQPICYLIQPLLHLLHLLLVKVPCTVLQPVYHVVLKLWSVFREIVIFRLFATQIAGLKNVVCGAIEVFERSMRLDPFKAQLIVMRSNVLNSGKALGLGLVYIFKSIERRVWFVIRRQPDDKDD